MKESLKTKQNIFFYRTDINHCQTNMDNMNKKKQSSSKHHHQCLLKQIGYAFGSQYIVSKFSVSNQVIH